MNSLGRVPGAAVVTLVAVLLSSSPAVAAPWVPRLPGTHASTNPEHFNSHYCDGCDPPLTYAGGRVADTTGEAGLTIRPIYWIPAASRPFDKGYVELTSRYITDIAAASGATDNALSLTPQYFQKFPGAQTFLRNRYTAEPAIIDTHPFPEGDCGPSEDYTYCLTDDQLRDELTRLRTELGLPTGLDHFYPVFPAPDLQTQDRDGSYSAEAYCGYHRSFGSHASPMVYGNETYLDDGCGEGQSPNHNIPADSAINVFSHELAEMVTDPVEDEDAWRDGSGAEIGDICGDDYGRPLGSADPGDPDHTKYNQLINGNMYYTQTEFSNIAFAKKGFGYGCQQRADAVTPPAPPAGKLDLQAVVPTLAANGKAKTDVYGVVTTPAGDALANDPVQFNAYTWAGTGGCGTVSGADAKTGADGTVDATYTASKDDAICAVVLKDALAGKSTTVLVYQGRYRTVAPKGGDSFPTRIAANGRARTFATTFLNRSGAAIDHAAISLDLFPGSSGRTLKASRVKLSYSLTGPRGRFLPLRFTGYRTIGDETVSLPVGSRTGQSIGAHRSLKVYYRMTILPGAYTARGAADVFHIGSFLDQVNAAAGTSATVAETLTTYVKVVPRR
ncbi:hypothetical protein NBH00_12300 [Paraconexibacter antarcticus]|uniref:Uncharacterized protein n=1 Tax=Paraconexibacter antarcticus TaxID=2949664 RepID=A0ABY5E2D1_9ACTN|nr:hypothetical protein [Paraconexibacter antarcticus]UTI66960.1 hypothetical protein NBH00_12300 [Paraconexibacter antarcticus]